VHADPVARLAIALAVLLVAAKLFGHLATRIGQPAVLGELVAGVVLGNAGIAWLDGLKADPTLDALARLGALVLLFGVGLESSLAQLIKVGASALLVAALGVAGPFALGWLVSAWLLPTASPYVHAFLGATLCATSVGITARVLKDLGRLQTDEARIILGAAVIDDVLGLLVLAVVTGGIEAQGRGASPGAWPLVLVVAKAAAFLVAAIALGVWLSRPLFRVAARLRASGVLIAVGLSFCLALAWLADAVGLAAIVGAFAAGLVLDDAHSREFVARGEPGLSQLLEPIAALLVPVFFVLMGLRTDLRALALPGMASLALALTAAALVGKQLCSLGVLREGVDRLSVGLGMIPRGEVGLIFAGVGAGLTLGGQRVIGDAAFAAIVVMVVVTTMVTPPLLKWSLARGAKRPPP